MEPGIIPAGQQAPSLVGAYPVILGLVGDVMEALKAKDDTNDSLMQALKTRIEKSIQAANMVEQICRLNIVKFRYLIVFSHYFISARFKCFLLGRNNP